ncbi:MAG TPA: PepSY domain-containing protein [Iamia sp.]|nr:PepSY domain-containing protein [Iamia sp.]
MSTKTASRTNRLLIGAVAVIGVLAGAAGIASAVTGDGGSDPAPTISRADAEAAAVEEVPGTVVGAETDDEDGQAVWSIDVDGTDGSRHEVEIDEGGAVVGRDVDDDGPGDDDGRDDDGRDDEVSDPALVEAAEVSQDEAEQAALAEAPGTVSRAHIEREDGRVVWDVEIDGEDGRRADVQVDAATGEIVELDLDD